ncbi:hypothetical protein ACFPT7_19230 [Acidicapsa dinghuensis]|uniref:Uncharacterized protein n=1 Tax=Acidicapsa dinghuensis TaxID=2218256 RepID=A0ABW1ENC0_9BACT|nr:hypothetical protein [Acidicapsa dinghuensis]
MLLINAVPAPDLDLPKDLAKAQQITTESLPIYLPNTAFTLEP